MGVLDLITWFYATWPGNCINEVQGTVAGSYMYIVEINTLFYLNVVTDIDFA